MGTRNPKSSQQDLNQQIYLSVLEREEARQQELARRQRKSFDVIGMLLGVGIIVMLILAGTTYLF